MSENNDTGTGELEEAAREGTLPGVEEADAAAEEGRDTSATPDDEGDGQTDDDAPAGGVVMGAINQH
ncbi:MAG TPA: hypothetical protein VF612_02150 [Jatrophihabitans sp.]|jgi:hypothetical protein|uniref:hypothetical protein n=1 Tax=Jatrophihabitans sp. TaxID=1932789 RepID=UPI002EDC64F3